MTLNPLASVTTRVYAAVPLGFAALLYFSGVYEIPFLPFDVASVARAKQFLFVCLMVLMALFLQWRVAMRSWFTLFCAVWALLHVGLWVTRGENGGIYFHQLVQIAFIWAFVNFVVQRKKASEPFLGLRIYFSPPLFAVACLLLTLFVFHPELVQSVTGGLGGNRFGFSIWLSQFVFLTFLVSLARQGQSVLGAFAWATPILVLQVLSGGRTGLVASLAIWLYFAHRQGGVRLFIMSILYLAVLIGASTALSTLSYVRADETIIRLTQVVPDAVYVFPGDTLLGWLDRLSSYRIGIVATALQTLNADTLLLGKGVNNFEGHIPWGTAQVHNVFIRALGEVGVVGFGALIALLALPLLKQAKSADTTAAKVFCGVFVLVGMLHSEFLVTGISTCMIFWLCYAEVLRCQESGAR